MKFLRIVFCFCVVHGFVASVHSQNSRLTAEQVIKKMVTVYSEAKTYQESGTVWLVKDINQYRGKSWEDVLAVSDFEKTKKVTFSFYYQRPGRLRFEWIDNQSKVTRRSVIWSNGKDAYSWRTDYEDNDNIFIWDRESTLKWAINEETRESMSVADILYNALTGNIEFYSYSKMTQSRIVREESIGKDKCFVVLGYISRDPWVLWVDTKTFALRRYRMQIATGSFDESVRTGYMPSTLGEVNHENIKINSAVKRSVFNFKPRLQKGDIDISKYKDDGLMAPPPPSPLKNH